MSSIGLAGSPRTAVLPLCSSDNGRSAPSTIWMRARSSTNSRGHAASYGATRTVPLSRPIELCSSDIAAEISHDMAVTPVTRRRHRPRGDRRASQVACTESCTGRHRGRGVRRDRSRLDRYLLLFLSRWCFSGRPHGSWLGLVLSGLALDQEPWLLARNRRMMVHAREAVVHVTPPDGHPGMTTFRVDRLQKQRQFVGGVGEQRHVRQEWVRPS